MLLFTWNLSKKEKAFRLALDYLAQFGDEFLAVFQELPAIANSADAARGHAITLTKDRVTCLGVVGSQRAPGRLGLFSSIGIAATQSITADPNDRTIRTVIKSTSGADLGVVGIHAVDRRNTPTEYARMSWAGQLRTELENFWGPYQALVVMGDFNADPYHPEVSARRGMFAVRDRVEADVDWESSLIGGKLRPLYNPMWRLLPESSTRPSGTYLLNSEDQGIRWRLCDQILVSRDLIGRINGDPEILPRLSGSALTTKRGYPSSSKFSDHLPVQLRLKM
jgi:exonuclease III